MDVLNFTKFIELSAAPPDWVYLERFIEVNRKSVGRPYHEIRHTRDMSGRVVSHRIGIILKKKERYIEFMTTTIHRKKYVYNHLSLHQFGGALIGGNSNAFHSDVKVDAAYVDSLLASCIEQCYSGRGSRSGKFNWDIVRVEEMNQGSPDTPSRSIRGLFFPPFGIPYLREYKKEEIFGDEPTAGVSIMGTDHLGFKLALICLDVPEGYGINKNATLILSHLKDVCPIRYYRIDGPAILLDDDGDVTEEQWVAIKNVMLKKMKKAVPDQIKIMAAKAEKQEEDNEMFRIMRDRFLHEVEHYGEREGEFPDWF